MGHRDASGAGGEFAVPAPTLSACDALAGSWCRSPPQLPSPSSLPVDLKTITHGTQEITEFRIPRPTGSTVSGAAVGSGGDVGFGARAVRKPGC